MKERSVVTSLVGAAGFAAAALAASPAHGEGPIRDNSFLVEEAYNQERGVIQHINTFELDPSNGAWHYALTDEWPLYGQAHQISVMVPLASGDAGTGVGDVAVHYRWQLLGIPAADGSADRLAFAPRLTVSLPTGTPERGDRDGIGIETNLPVSIDVAPQLVLHTNLGGSWVPVGDGGADALGLTLAQSLIWLAGDKLNFLVEGVWTRTTVTASATSEAGHEDGLRVSPGLRVALDLPGGMQIVPGLAVPIGVGPSAGEWSTFAYLSIEHAVF